MRNTHTHTSNECLLYGALGILLAHDSWSQNDIVTETLTVVTLTSTIQFVCTIQFVFSSSSFFLLLLNNDFCTFFSNLLSSPFPEWIKLWLYHLSTKWHSFSSFHVDLFVYVCDRRSHIKLNTYHLSHLNAKKKAMTTIRDFNRKRTRLDFTQKLHIYIYKLRFKKNCDVAFHHFPIKKINGEPY